MKSTWEVSAILWLILVYSGQIPSTTYNRCQRSNVVNVLNGTSDIDLKLTLLYTLTII